MFKFKLLLHSGMSEKTVRYQLCYVLALEECTVQVCKEGRRRKPARTKPLEPNH
jgi:hypothetical protein